MTTIARWFTRGTIAALALGGTLAVLLLGPNLQAQEGNGKGDAAKGRSLIRDGYTRPGLPADKQKDGKILPVVGWQQTYKGKILGGTVYFAVFERTRTEGDTWGTGLANFDSMFMQGRSFKDTFSPALDTKAKYLYLYQVVNDRGLDSKGIKPAGPNQDIRVEDLAMAAVKLLVDPRYITSWGHFKQSGFVMTVPDLTLQGEPVGAAKGLPRKTIRMAVSSNVSILDELPVKKFRPRSPAYPLQDLRKSFAVNVSNLNLKTAGAYEELQKRAKVKEAANWVKNEVAAAEGGKEPAFVQLLWTDTAGGEVAAPAAAKGEEEGVPFSAAFRADWKDEGILKLGQHSVLIGFTSDLPPVDEGVRIADAEASRTAGIVPAAGIAPTGTVPTPTPVTPAVAPAGAPAGAGSVGGVAGGTGIPGFGGVGGIGAARPGFAGGGGTGSGGGSPGSGTGTTNGTTTGTGSSSGTQTPSQGQTINFSPTLTNQQQQQQQQQQLQQRVPRTPSPSPTPGQQSFTDTIDLKLKLRLLLKLQRHPRPPRPPRPPQVVPEPGALLLAALGLPGLLLLRRRKVAVGSAAV